MRQEMDHIAAKRAEWDELEKEIVRALREEECIYEKGVALEIVRAVRSAEDVLLKDYFKLNESK
jgi:hypothetical protein